MNKFIRRLIDWLRWLDEPNIWNAFTMVCLLAVVLAILAIGAIVYFY